MSRTAVVLFNLGGPDRAESVRGFLFNLFNDGAIIRLPQPFRAILAWIIAARRAPVARRIYRHLGGGSPILANTEAQARALEAELGPDYRCFIAMRYWHPMSDAAAQAVKSWRPDRIVLLPLYPQFSSTTTQSSLAAWRKSARSVGLDCPADGPCCYPADPGFIAALTTLIRNAQAELPPGLPARVLFSAHGLPKTIIDRGDPYQWQVERTVADLRAALSIDGDDSVICYQSRVGPLEWIGPATTAEIARAGRDGVAIIMVPVAFVSEHSETLVELDIEYRELARTSGVPAYLRVPTVGVSRDFITGLASLVRAGHTAGSGLDRCAYTACGERLCPPGFACCGFARPDS